MFEQKRAHLVHIDQYIKTLFDEPLSKERIAQLFEMAGDEKKRYKGDDDELAHFSKLLTPDFVDLFFLKRKAPKKNKAFRELCSHFIRLVVFVELYKQLRGIENADGLKGNVKGHLLFEVDALICPAAGSFDCMYVLDYFHQINHQLFEGNKQEKSYTAIRAIVSQLSPSALSGFDIPSLIRRDIVSFEEAYCYFFKDLQKGVDRMPYKERLKAFERIVLVMQSAPEMLQKSDRDWVGVVYAGLVLEYRKSRKGCSIVLLDLMKLALEVVLVLSAVLLKYTYVLTKISQQLVPPEAQRPLLTLELPCALLWGAFAYGAYGLHFRSKGPAPLRSPGTLPELGQCRQDKPAKPALVRARG